ncbi:MAG TPA: hypothetical protein VIV20_01490 [Gammaproteobacteria bacterium]
MRDMLDAPNTESMKGKILIVEGKDVRHISIEEMEKELSSE